MSSLHNVVKTLMCSTSEDLECQSHICHASISNSSQYILRKKKKKSHCGTGGKVRGSSQWNLSSWEHEYLYTILCQSNKQMPIYSHG